MKFLISPIEYEPTSFDKQFSKEVETPMKKIMASLLSLALLLSCVSAVAETVSGSAQGFGGPVTVELTMDGTTITDVAITADAETPSIGGAALDTLKAQLLAAQSAEIDSVAGATITSDAVKAAAAQALAGEATVAKLTAGTYTSTKTGYQDTVTVEVTVSETSILDVKVTEITDHPETVIAIPCQQIPADIVATQSVLVDTVTGATMTSNAIIAAVTDCLEQAGGSAAFMTPVAKPEIVAGEDVTVDVLVVGGGGAGILASMAASMEDLDGKSSGLKVMMIEKMAYLGGSTGVSGGYYFTYNDETGAYDDAWLEASLETETAILQSMSKLPVNTALLRHELSITNDTNVKLPQLGLEVIHGAFIGHEEEMDHDHWLGWNLTLFANEYFPASEVDVRTNTKATKLLTDDTGAVIGAVVEDKTSTYNVYAKKVILACGGFPHNPELIAKYAPDYVGTIPFAVGGNTGDGIVMATEIGAATVGDSMLGYLGSDGVYGMWDEHSDTFHWGNVPELHVNIEGNRFCDETMSENVEYALVLQQPQDMAWSIADSDNPGIASLINSNSKHVYKADTIEALAEQIDVPVDALAATIAKHNADIDAGEDTLFGTPVESMDKIDAAPYYACVVRPIALSSLVGLSVNENLEVLKADGTIIPNLYASGDLVLGGNYITYYVGARGVGTAVYTGRLAGECAKDAILAK